MNGTGPIDRLSKAVGEKVSYVYLAAVIITFWEVVSRYVFNAPTIWAHESTITLSGVAFIIGGVYTMQRREHIEINVVYSLLPPRLRHVLDIVNGVIAVAYLSVLTYAGTIVARKSLAVMETSASAWNMPTPVVLKTALVVGCALMVLQAASQLRGHCRRKDDTDKNPT